MTKSVYITPRKEDWERFKKLEPELEKAFIELHDQTFKQEVSIHKFPDGTTHGTVEEMKHGLGMWIDPESRASGNGFVSIPCHWDYDHMVQTAKDARKLVKKFGFKNVRIQMSG